MSWDEAVQRARHLTEDGAELSEAPQDIWRLPSREEIVRSMTRGGLNAGGTWDTQSARAKYERRPDKESPLWDQYAPLIYLWTADEESENRAWIVVYTVAYLPSLRPWVHRASVSGSASTAGSCE